MAWLTIPLMGVLLVTRRSRVQVLASTMSRIGPIPWLFLDATAPIEKVATGSWLAAILAPPAAVHFGVFLPETDPAYGGNASELAIVRPPIFLIVLTSFVVGSGMALHIVRDLPNIRGKEQAHASMPEAAPAGDRSEGEEIAKVREIVHEEVGEEDQVEREEKSDEKKQDKG